MFFLLLMKRLGHWMRKRIDMTNIKPLNVCMDGVAVTLNTRYERLCIEHLMSLAHFPRTGVMIEYE